MEAQQLRETIIKELPILVQNNEAFRQAVLKITTSHFADKSETESRFDRMMDMFERRLEQDAEKWKSQEKKWKIQEKKWEAQEKKWDAQEKKWETQEKKWDAQEKKWIDWNKEWKAYLDQDTKKWDDWNKKWEENQVVIRNMLAEIKKLDRKYESTIGALGTRWGLHSEASFRNALKGILEDVDNIEVLNVNEYDDEGFVFGRPDQVELDIIIKNGLLIVCEIKSSMGKAAMYIFERKIRFYENHHNRKASRMIVISPMIDDKAKVVAKNLGIEIYSYADDVDL